MRHNTAADGVALSDGGPYSSPRFHQHVASHKRPKLLFLARAFPPLRATACVRGWNIAKFLARLGWDVTVVTPHPSAWRHVESPSDVEFHLEREGIRRILTEHRWRCLAPTSLNC